MKNEIKGAILVLAAAFFWGFAATAAKFIFNNNIDPFKLVNMRLNLAFILLFIYYIIFDRQKLKATRYDIKNLAVLGIVGIAGVQTTYYYTMASLNVAMAIFLQYLAPAIIVLYSVIFQKEKLSKAIGFSLLVSLLGSSFMIFGRKISGTAPINSIGMVTGIISAFFLSFYTLFSKKCTTRLNPWTVLLYALGFGALAYWFMSPPWILWRGVTPKELAFAAYIAIFATIIPFGLYLSGLHFLTPSTGSILSMLEPVIATASAYLLLNEKMTVVQMLGGTMIIAAVIIINKYFMKKENI